MTTHINTDMTTVLPNARPIIGYLGLACVLLAAGLVFSSLPVVISEYQTSTLQTATTPNIDVAVSRARTRIGDFAATDPQSFAAVLRQTFGTKLATDKAYQLTQQAVRGQLPFARNTVFVPAQVLKGAAGAYASDEGGLILINEEIRADTALLSDVILHEWAHHLDAILGPVDTMGEEGDIFLLGINRMESITANELNFLRQSQHGHSTIHFRGREMAIEQGFFDFITAPFRFVAKVVTDPVGAVSDVGKGVANTVVSVGEGVHSAGKGVVNMSTSLVSGNFEGVVGGALDIATAPGNLINKTATELNTITPGLGTAVNVGVGFTPAAPLVAGAQGLSDTRNGFRNGGLEGGFSALGYATLDVGMSGVSRANKGLKGAGFTKAVKAKPTTFLGKAKAFPGTAVSSIKKNTPVIKNLDKYPLTRATKKEIALGKKLMAPGKEGTLKIVTTLGDTPIKKGIDLGIKGNIPGRDRDQDGNLLGTGGTSNQIFIEGLSDGRDTDPFTDPADPASFIDPALAATASLSDPDPADECTSGPQASASIISDIQIALFNKGYDPGPADGVAGQRTVDAIKDFQSDNGDDFPGGCASEQILAELNSIADPGADPDYLFDNTKTSNTFPDAGPSIYPAEAAMVGIPVESACAGSMNEVTGCCDIQSANAFDVCMVDINDPSFCDDEEAIVYDDCLLSAQRLNFQSGSKDAYTVRAPAPIRGFSSGVGSPASVAGPTQ